MLACTHGFASESCSIDPEGRSTCGASTDDQSVLLQSRVSLDDGQDLLQSHKYGTSLSKMAGRSDTKDHDIAMQEVLAQVMQMAHQMGLPAENSEEYSDEASKLVAQLSEHPMTFAEGSGWIGDKVINSTVGPLCPSEARAEAESVLKCAEVAVATVPLEKHETFNKIVSAEIQSLYSKHECGLELRNHNPEVSAGTEAAQSFANWEIERAFDGGNYSAISNIVVMFGHLCDACQELGCSARAESLRKELKIAKYATKSREYEYANETVDKIRLHTEEYFHDSCPDGAILDNASLEEFMHAADPLTNCLSLVQGAHERLGVDTLHHRRVRFRTATVLSLATEENGLASLYLQHLSGDGTRSASVDARIDDVVNNGLSEKQKGKLQSVQDRHFARLHEESIDAHCNGLASRSVQNSQIRMYHNCLCKEKEVLHICVARSRKVHPGDDTDQSVSNLVQTGSSLQTVVSDTHQTGIIGWCLDPPPTLDLCVGSFCCAIGKPQRKSAFKSKLRSAKGEASCSLGDPGAIVSTIRSMIEDPAGCLEGSLTLCGTFANMIDIHIKGRIGFSGDCASSQSDKFMKFSVGLEIDICLGFIPSALKECLEVVGLSHCKNIGKITYFPFIGKLVVQFGTPEILGFRAYVTATLPLHDPSDAVEKYCKQNQPEPKGNWQRCRGSFMKYLAYDAVSKIMHGVLAMIYRSIADLYLMIFLNDCDPNSCMKLHKMNRGARVELTGSTLVGQIANVAVGNLRGDVVIDWAYLKQLESTATAATLQNLGGSGCTPSKTCGQCQGDCDSDNDCASGFKCFQREHGESIPGCSAGGAGDVRNYDYCYKPAALQNLGASGCTASKKCRLCQGDCDTDNDCASGLKCFQREHGESIPGCSAGGAADVRNYDYCYQPR
jgi:hypothetical protein